MLPKKMEIKAISDELDATTDPARREHQWSYRANVIGRLDGVLEAWSAKRMKTA